MKNSLYRVFGVLFAIVFLPGCFSEEINSHAAPEKYGGVMLQAFYWDSYNETNWTALASQADEIAAFFDLVWLPPSGNSLGSAQYPNMGYHPVYYFDQNSSFGTQEQLKRLISSLKLKGCGAIADIVINHRNGVSDWTDFPVETYKNVTYAWGPEAICSGDEVTWASGQPMPLGAPDTGDNWDGARDIDHTNPNVQATIEAYLDFMKNEMGYAGWRYDLVKGYSPCYVGKYNMSGGCKFSVGECWDNYDRITQWITGTIIDNHIRSGAFDFPLKYALQSACNYDNWSGLVWKRYGWMNQPAGLIHMDGFARFAYTFVDNHDTYVKDGDAIVRNILAANAFVLTHPGIPCVFYPHWRDHKDAIKAMIAARKQVGIHNQSKVEILETSGDIYVAKVSGKYGELLIKVGSRYEYNPPAGYTLRTSGPNYAIWTTSG